MTSRRDGGGTDGALADLVAAQRVLLAEIAELRREVRELRDGSAAAMGFVQAAHHLGVSERTIARWVADGRLRLVPHTDRRRLIARIELERFASTAAEC